MFGERGFSMPPSDREARESGSKKAELDKKMKADAMSSAAFKESERISKTDAEVNKSRIERRDGDEIELPEYGHPAHVREISTKVGMGNEEKTFDLSTDKDDKPLELDEDAYEHAFGKKLKS